jgi:hypothetical protein
MLDQQVNETPALRPLPEFCRVYRVGRDYVYDQLHAGILEAVKVNNRTHITGDSEQRWRASLPRFRAGRSIQSAA